VDDLLKYINGEDGKPPAKMSTRKAAKRARQKQRKVCICGHCVFPLDLFFLLVFILLPHWGTVFGTVHILFTSIQAQMERENSHNCHMMRF